MAKELDATLVDLNATEPYSDYATVPVPGNGEIYNSFTLTTSWKKSMCSCRLLR